MTPVEKLFAAMHAESLPRIKALLEENPELVKVVSETGCTFLHVAAEMSDPEFTQAFFGCQS